MSLGGFDIPTNFKVFEAKDILGEVMVYGVPQQSQGDQVAHFWALATSRSSLVTEFQNKTVPFTAGIIKRIGINVLIDTGGSMNVNTTVNGANILAGTINGASIQELFPERSFLAGDIVGCLVQRTSSTGTWITNGYIEVDYAEPNDFYQQWFSSFYRTGAGAHGNFYVGGGNFNSESNNPASLTENQIRMVRPGTVRDMNYYGISPVGADFIPSLQCLVNGSIETDETLSQHAGASEDLFTGIDIPFLAGDLLSFAARSAVNAANLEGVVGAHIEFDEF